MINHSISVCRLVYNLGLQVRKEAYKNGIRLQKYTLDYQITDLRKEYDWIAAVDTEALRESIKSLDNSFKRFFNGLGGYPKFKKKFDSIQSYKTSSKSVKVNWGTKKCYIPKVSNIKIAVSREFKGDIKYAVISKTSTGKYYISFCVKEEDPNIIIRGNNGIGIDLGLSAFAVLSNGHKIIHPHFFKTNEKRLEALQRQASKKKKGSKNRRKAYKRVALLYAKIANQRLDFLHKTSSQIIYDNQIDTVCVEDLAIKNLLKNRSLSKSIHDSGWGEFVRMLKYKASWCGKNFIQVNQWFASSKICSKCGHKEEEMPLDMRIWECRECNTSHDRDINAAINIKNSGMGNPDEPVELLAIAKTKKQE